MFLLLHVGLTAVLSALLSVTIRRERHLLLLGAIALMTVGLWAILDGIWQPTYAFSVVEPSLLVVVLAGILGTCLLGKFQVTALALLTFIATGCLTTVAIQQSIGLDPVTVLREALDSGLPMVSGAIVGISVYGLAMRVKFDWPNSIAFGIALTLALVLDSTLYMALTGELAWSAGDWGRMLFVKLTDKVLLALWVVTPIVFFELANPD